MKLGRRGRWIIIIVVSFLVAGSAYGGWIFWLYRDAQRTVRDPSLDRVVEPPAQDRAPFFVLLVGSDSREGLSEEEQDRLGAQDENPNGTAITGERADTLILARVDLEADHMTLVSFPRDLYVTFPDGSTGKVNGALERSRRFLVSTVESLTGLDMNRYAQVNIAGFRDLVDAIGGIDVCIAEPVPFDRQTGFEVTADEIGMVHFDGEEALRYVRTRKVLPGGDFDRIANQQKLLAAAISKVATISTVFRPDRIQDLLQTVKESVRTDSYSSLTDLKELGERFKVLSEDKLDVYIVPNKGTAINEAGDVVLPARRKMALLFSELGEGEPDPSIRTRLSQWSLDVPVRGAIPPVCRD